MSHHRLATLFLALLPAATAAAQTTVSVPCDRDTTLYASSNTRSNGSGASVFVGVTSQGSPRRALVRFAIGSSIPAGAKILAASLQMNVVQAVAFLPVTANVHRATQGWGEGSSNSGGPAGGQGAPAQNGDATWTQRIVPGTQWTTPGGDFVATPSCALSMPNGGLAIGNSTDGAVADVQFWLNNPAQNYGWLLKAANESQTSTAHRLDSRNGGAVPPTLVVTYMLPGQSGTWGTGCPVGAGTMATAFAGTPTGGASIQITHGNTVPSSLGANYFSLGLDTVGAPLGLPNCTVYLPLSQPLIPGDVFVTSASGTAASPFQVPSGFPGYLVTCQSAVLANNPLGFLLGNAALIVLQ